jgi:hypothetical protein
MVDLTLYAVRIHDRRDDDDPEVASVIFADSFDGPWYDMVTGALDFCTEVVQALRNAQRPAIDNDTIHLETRLHRAAVDSMMWDKTVGEAIDHALAEIARLRIENGDYRTRVDYLSRKVGGEVTEAEPTDL